MFTTYNNKNLIKSQFRNITINNIFNIIFYIFMLLTYIKIIDYNNLKIIPLNIAFFIFIIYFSYNLLGNIKNLKELIFFNKELKVIIKNKEITIFNKDVTDKIKDKLDPKININNLTFTDDINKIRLKEKELKIISSPEAVEIITDEIEKIINPNLVKKTKIKRKQIEKIKEIKGIVKEKINKCMNVISVRENGYITPFYCKNRYCPICSYIKTTKNHFLIMDILKKYNDKKLLFLTLTTKNVKVESGVELKEERKKIADAFTKFYKKLKNITGYIRTIEIVYNKERDDYNIHIHCILLVINYLKEYITKEQYLKIWQVSTGDEAITTIDKKMIKKNLEDIKKVSGYIAKEELEKMTINDKISNIFYIAENKAKNLTFGGEFRKAKKEIEENKNKEKEENKIISNIVSQMMWNNEKNLYIN